MPSHNALFADMVRAFDPEIIAERLRKLYAEGQSGTLFCSCYHYTEVMHYQYEHRMRYADTPWMVFGRDLFGKQSLCYRVNANMVEVKRIPGQINAGWREIPQGAVVVIRSEEVVRNGIAFNEQLDKLHLQFTFKDLWLSECHVFYFTKCEAVNMFRERLENSVETVRMHQVHGCEDLLTLNTELLPDLEVREKSDHYVDEFIDIFRRIMPTRYLPPIHDKVPLLFLFSGGVDSLFVTLMAAMMADEDQEFVLANVSFSEDGADFEDAPDRARGALAYEFLKEKFPHRVFHFLRVNITKDELQKERTSLIGKAIAPGNSVLDESIGCVVWFACRAWGYEDGVETCYDRAVHVFVGSGSDEILGGYSRHKGKFEREGYPGLFNELRLELENIGNRNLGRDDRVALSNCRLMVAPFLDEDVVRFVNALPIQAKVDFSLPRGYGDKMVLRNSLKKLGCPEELYSAPKKAMQFGTRITKFQPRGEKGYTVSARLQLNAEEPLPENV